jgi:hypothetical protein
MLIEIPHLFYGAASLAKACSDFDNSEDCRNYPSWYIGSPTQETDIQEKHMGHCFILNALEVRRLRCVYGGERVL